MFIGCVSWCSDVRNALFATARALELRLEAQFAARSRAQLLGFCERLAAAMDAQDAELASGLRPGTSQAVAVSPLTKALAVSATARPAAPFAPQLRVALPSEPALGPQTPRRNRCEVRSAALPAAAQAAGSTPTTACHAAKPAVPPPAKVADLRGCTAESVPAPEPHTVQQDEPPAPQLLQPNTVQQDEPPAPQTPQKLAPARLTAAASPHTPLGQSSGRVGLPPLCAPWEVGATAGCSCEGGSTADSATAAATTTAASAAMGQQPQPACESVGAVSAAEAVALAAVCATAATPRERAAAGRFPWPLYFIATRDCFTFELEARTSYERVHFVLGVFWPCCSRTTGGQHMCYIWCLVARILLHSACVGGWRHRLHEDAVLLPSGRAAWQLLRGRCQIDTSWWRFRLCIWLIGHKPCMSRVHLAHATPSMRPLPRHRSWANRQLEALQVLCLWASQPTQRWRFSLATIRLVKRVPNQGNAEHPAIPALGNAHGCCKSPAPCQAAVMFPVCSAVGVYRGPAGCH